VWILRHSCNFARFMPSALVFTSQFIRFPSCPINCILSSLTEKLRSFVGDYLFYRTGYFATLALLIIRFSRRDRSTFAYKSFSGLFCGCIASFFYHIKSMAVLACVSLLAFRGVAGTATPNMTLPLDLRVL
jgi:hypothetical protein